MKPPTLAMWLLGRFGVHQSVIGDLVERYQRRRQSLWFWRQAVSAILACLVRDVRTRKFLTFRAVLIGTLAVWAFSWLTAPPATWIVKGFSNWTIEHNTDALRMFVFESNRWLLRIPGTLPWVLAGWTIARFHRPNGLSMVVALISAWLIFLVGVTLIGFLGPSRSLTSATANAYLATVIPRFLSFATFTFIGGLVGARPIAGHRQPT